MVRVGGVLEILHLLYVYNLIDLPVEEGRFDVELPDNPI